MPGKTIVEDRALYQGICSGRFPNQLVAIAPGGSKL